MTNTLIPPDLFSAAGVVLEDVPPAKVKRPRKPKPPSPAERAMVARTQAERRGRRLGATEGRVRIGSPRDLHPRKVFSFPFSRNAAVLNKMLQSLPHFYADNFEIRWASEGRKWERRLIKSGIPKDEAYECARELLDAALNVRATEAQKETGSR